MISAAIGMKQPTKPHGFAYKPIAVPKAAINLPSVGNDPLDDFMALRMKMSTASNRQPAGTLYFPKFLGILKKAKNFMYVGHPIKSGNYSSFRKPYALT